MKKDLRKYIFLTLFVLFWAAVIFMKQGGQSLLIHYAWPFLTLFTLVFLFEKEWLKNKMCWLSFIALLGISIYLLSFIFDLTPSDGSIELINISSGIIMALLLSQVKWNEKLIRYLFILIIAVVVLMDIFGLFTYATGHPLNRFVGPLIKPNESFNGYPNLAANLQLLALLPAFIIFVKSQAKSKITAILVVLANVIILTSLTLTFSRGAWVSAALLGLFAIYYFYKNRKNFTLISRYFISFIVIAVLSIAAITGINFLRGVSENAISVKDKITFTSEDEGSSVTERITSIERGIEMASDYPLFGVGAGSFNYISQSHEKNFETLSSYPYSLPVKLLAENGIPAFSLLIFFICAHLILSVKNNKGLSKIAAITVLILLLHHTIDNNFNFFAASFPVFLLLGVSWPKTKKICTRSLFILIPLFLMITLGVLFVIHEAWYGNYYINGRNAAGAGDHETAFENYNKSVQLFYERDALLASALSAYETENLNMAEEKANYYIRISNPLDKRGPVLLANIASKNRKYGECLEWLDKARELGGENSFDIDYYELACSLATGDKENFNNIKAEVIPKLEKYLDLLKVNAHMTVLTDNPKFAVKILELIKNNDQKLNDLYKEMKETAILETEKFHTKYGIEAEVRF